MSDNPQPSLKNPNQAIAAAEGKKGLGKIYAIVIGVMASTYITNWCSLHGVDFKFEYGGVAISSEVVKSALETSIVTMLYGATPEHFKAWCLDAILKVRISIKQFKEALTNPLP